MAEQSSAAVAVRAFVMLGCLVVIPVVALFGNALPEAIDQVVGTWWTPRTAVVSEETAEEAPLFEPLLRSPAQDSAPGPLAGCWPSERPPEPAADRVAGAAAGVLSATYEAPVEAPSGHRAPHAPAAPVEGGSLASGPPAEFRAIYDRLKELGSTYVLLESWGDSQEQFRFYCKIAVAGNPHYTYRFEATSPDPLVAMSRVLQQVENWRAARYGN